MPGVAGYSDGNDYPCTCPYVPPVKDAKPVEVKEESTDLEDSED